MPPSPGPRSHCPSHRLKREPTTRLKNSSAVLFKEPHQEGVRFMRWGNRVQMESIPRNFISSVIDLCGGGWGSWIPLCPPPPAHPTVAGSERSDLQHTGIFSEAGPQGSCLLCLAVQFPETSLSASLTSCALKTCSGRFIPPAETGVTDVEETGYRASHVTLWYLSKFESDECECSQPGSF